MKVKIIAPLLLLLAPLLNGCNTTATTVDLSEVVIAEPLEVQYRHQLHLVRLNEMIDSAKFTNKQKAYLLYERGVIYDELGLKSLAHLDFRQALQLKPDLAEAYNFIGVYMTLASNFDQAYEAFDSANELNPDYQFAIFSRGIALYYGDRAKLGAADLQQFLDFKPSDPYRMVWQYIVQAEYDKTLALQQLRQNAVNAAKDHWATVIVKLYLGTITEREFLATLDDNVRSHTHWAERLCEAYFYLGKLRSLNGNSDAALDFYRLSLSTNVYGFIEHKYARLELDINQ